MYSVVGSSLRAIVIHDPQWTTKFPKATAFGAPVREIEDIIIPDEAKTSLVLYGMQSEAFETAYGLAAKQGQVTFCRGCKARYLISDSYCSSCGEKNSLVSKREPPVDSETEPPKKTHRCSDNEP